jgi:alkylation response protein AidB-like acyl-CoA dehydrogenase
VPTLTAEQKLFAATVLQIYEGTNQIQRLVLSRILAARLKNPSMGGAVR